MCFFVFDDLYVPITRPITVMPVKSKDLCHSNRHPLESAGGWFRSFGSKASNHDCSVKEADQPDRGGKMPWLHGELENWKSLLSTDSFDTDTHLDMDVLYVFQQGCNIIMVISPALQMFRDTAVIC